MPFQGQMPVKLTGGIAGAGLTAASIQYTFVKISADNTVVPVAAATDVPIGVIQAPAVAGQSVDVVVIGETMVQADVSLTAGQLIGTSADGQAAVLATTDTSKYVVGSVVNVAGATSAGNLVTAIINCANPTRAN